MADAFDDPEYQRLLRSAYEYYGSRKPHFVQEKRTTYINEKKEVIRATATGVYPELKDLSYTNIIARRWDHGDEEFIFWTLDIGSRRYIVKPKGRIHGGRRVAYRSWLGPEWLSKGEGFGTRNLAFGIIDPATVSESIANCRKVESDDEQITYDDEWTIPDDVSQPQHFMLGNSFQSRSNGTHDSNFRSKKRTRTSSISSDEVILMHRRRIIKEPSIIQEDRRYYGGVRPPFVVNKTKLEDRRRKAVLVDENGTITKTEILLQGREWNEKWMYWTTEINGKQEILIVIKGGPRACLYRRWLGHRRGIDKSIIAYPYGTKTPRRKAGQGLRDTSSPDVDTEEEPSALMTLSTTNQCPQLAIYPTRSSEISRVPASMSSIPGPDHHGTIAPPPPPRGLPGSNTTKERAATLQDEVASSMNQTCSNGDDGTPAQKLSQDTDSLEVGGEKLLERFWY